MIIIMIIAIVIVIVGGGLRNGLHVDDVRHLDGPLLGLGRGRPRHPGVGYDNNQTITA